MWGLHLKQKGRWWHYYRAVPREYSDIEPRKLISFSLKTGDFTSAKLKAAQISKTLETDWHNAKERGESLCSHETSVRYLAAIEIQAKVGLTPITAASMSDAQLIERLRLLLGGEFSPPEQKAIIGLQESPEIFMADAFDRFWDYIQDEWMSVSHDQRQVKRNVYLKAIRNFEGVVGKLKLHEVERSHAIAFRSWWMARVQQKGLKPYTGNREINSLRRMLTVNFDIEGLAKPNPFSRVRLKEIAEVTRIPLEETQIQKLLMPGALGKLHSDFQLLFRLLINTGMRPVEAIGLELEDIIIAHDVPHVHVRKNATRGLKTEHSERLLPLLGVSLLAAQDLAVMGGGKRLGKNMYATGIINRHFRSSGIVTDKRQSLYSLRHWFQDQLTKRDVIDRAQAQLMGHKFHRPKYGYGKDLGELRDIIAQFAIEAP